MEKTLEQIKDFADKAHGEQMRKYTPERYIVHPGRVMEICRQYTNDITMLAAALLHDVLEDTPVTKDEIHEFLVTQMNPKQAKRTIQMVTDLTDVFVKKDYPDMNRRTRKNKELERLEKTSADSQTIKYADIIDNTNEIVSHDRDFARVYLYECRTTLGKLNKGDPGLYHLAVKTVNSCIDTLR